MGAPKGKKHRTFTQEEKLKYIKQYFEGKRQKPPAIHVRKLAVSVVDFQLSKTPVA